MYVKPKGRFSLLSGVNSSDHQPSPMRTSNIIAQRLLRLLLIAVGFGRTDAFAQEYQVGGSPVQIGDSFNYKNPYEDKSAGKIRVIGFANGGIWAERLDVDANEPGNKRLYVSPANLNWLTRPMTAGDASKAAAPTPAGDAQAVAAANSYLCGTWDLGVAGADHVTDGKKVYDHLYGAQTGSITLNADGTYIWTFTTSVPTLRGKWRPCEPQENYVAGQGVRLLHAYGDRDWTLIKVPDNSNPTNPHADMVYATDGNGYYERGYRHK